MTLQRLPLLIACALASPTSFGQTEAQCTLLAQKYGKERTSLLPVELAQLQNCVKADLDKLTTPDVRARKDGSRTAHGIDGSRSSAAGSATGSASGSASPSTKHAAPKER
jgi:hypothetical protein